MTVQTLDFQAVTQAQRAAWSLGDFHHLARQIHSASENLCEAVDPRPGERVLDVGCGTGNTALVAARRYCDVTAVDFAPAMIERGRPRALAEGLDIEWGVQDAQALDFPDASFDVVVSVFAVMFAPDQERAAAELLRVCRPGGRIGLANWTPGSFAGQMFPTVARYAPPPPGLKPVVRWGTEAGVAELLGEDVSVTLRPRHVNMYFRSPEHAVETFCLHLGPVHRALGTLDPEGQQRLKADLLEVLNRFNVATDDTVVIESEYLEIVASRS